MPKQYRVGAFVRLNNAGMRALLRARVRLGSYAILTVRGRKSGRPIQIPLVVFAKDRDRYLIAAYGVVNWVRNLRAAGGQAALTCGSRTEKISATELPPAQAAPIFAESLRAGAPGIPKPIVSAYRRFFVLPYLDVDVNSSPEEFECAAVRHPVFLINTMG